MDTVNQVILVHQVVDIMPHLVDTADRLVDILDLLVDTLDQSLLQDIPGQSLLLGTPVPIVLQDILDLRHLLDIPRHLQDTPHHLQVTQHHLPDTPHHLPDTPHQVPDTLHHLPDTQHHLQDTPHHLVVMAAEGSMALIVPLHQVGRVQHPPFILQDLILLQYLGHMEDILHLHH